MHSDARTYVFPGQSPHSWCSWCTIPAILPRQALHIRTAKHKLKKRDILCFKKRKKKERKKMIITLKKSNALATIRIALQHQLCCYITTTKIAKQKDKQTNKQTNKEAIKQNREDTHLFSREASGPRSTIAAIDAWSALHAQHGNYGIKACAYIYVTVPSKIDHLAA